MKNLTVNRLCNEQVVPAVNESLPGPTILVKEGDTLIVHVINQSPYNLTIHWYVYLFRLFFFNVLKFFTSIEHEILNTYINECNTSSHKLNFDIKLDLNLTYYIIYSLFL